jgi:uncharacterized RDD family membrane protein YckC
VSDGTPALRVDSATGVEVSLPIAGPGARAYAFVIDWHIRFVFAVAWYCVGAILYHHSLSLAPPPTSDVRWFGAVVVPALVIYFLYHPVLELVLRGGTPGKRMAGVRLISRRGDAPSAGAVLVRNAFRVVDVLPAFYGLGLGLSVLSRDHVRCGDMAAGTLLVYDNALRDSPPPPQPMRAAGSLDADGFELAAELLQRWEHLERDARSRLARSLLARYGHAETSSGVDEAALQQQLRQLVGTDPVQA